MQKKIFRTSLWVSVAVLALLFASLTLGLYHVESEQLTASLREESRVMASMAQGGADEAGVLEGVRSSRRLTLVAPDGTVLYDSAANAATMENHSAREEIQSALQNGEATVTRRSGTLESEMVYHAVLLPSGNVLRLAATQRTVWGRLWGYLPWIALMLAGCLALSAVVSRVSTKRLIAPIARLDLEHPLDNDCYAELAPLLKRLYEQQQTGKAQMETLREQKEKTDALLSSMREGLVILNRNERILTLNGAARRILGLENRDCEGHTMLELNRNAALQAILSEARGAASVSGALTLGSRHYHVHLSRIGADEGYLLLMQDDTAESEAEAMRRQFTANVSHELRTPLTAIGGYAEMLESGMVEKGDEKVFIGRIRSESARMLTLVEDILRLSQLDEGSVSLIMREVDLKQTAEEVLRSLESKAQARNVTLSLTGESVKLTTDPTLLHEIMQNLADNAVKYNREGGKVEIALGAEDGRPSFTVRDTGIGIPREQQQKVFERFYRVDKSRSKQTGGTGLGLSIVKHAAILLGAKVSMQSEPGVGTSVTVRF